MKNHKLIAALFALILLLAVSITGAMAEEEIELIAEQPVIGGNLPAELAEEPETIPELPEAPLNEEIPEQETVTEEKAEEPKFVPELIEAPLNEEIPEQDMVTEEKPEKPEFIPELIEAPLNEEIPEQDATAEEKPEEPEFVPELPAAPAIEEIIPELNEAVQSEIFNPEFIPELPEVQDIEEAITENTIVLTVEQEKAEGEEEPKYKNGNEGLHAECTTTENSADFKFNMGVHKNDAESGRDVDLNLLHVHAGASAGAGGFIVVDTEGKVHDGYGVHAGCDAEIAALELEGNARLGSLKNNIHGGTSVAAGEAKAAADFTVGEVDGKVVVGINGNAELDAVEAKLSGGFTVDGVEVNGHVGGKLGIGAKLRLGYKDGKFGCDIGAALGVGIEFGFEVDVGAIADKVENAATEMAEKLIKSDITKTVVKTAAKVAGTVTNFFSKLWTW